MDNADYALSIKQPWAALIVYGRKFIEVRRWPTARRGRLLIHAARVSDPRPEAWRHLPEELEEMAQLTGGIIGAAELTGCISYRSRATFVKDRLLHLNEPSWFLPPVVFGFAFTRPEALAFRRCPGWVRFFPVNLKDDNLKDDGSARQKVKAGRKA
jgi:ASCH domain